MIFDPKDKAWKEKLKRAEREELEAYCKEKKFTKAQTERFVQNSMKQLYRYESLDESSGASIDSSGMHGVG